MRRTRAQLEHARLEAMLRELHRAGVLDDDELQAKLVAFGIRRRGEVGVMHWVWLIIVGLIVGALGRALHPGRDPMGWILTLALGVVSLVIAGLIFSNGVLEFIVGIVVAAVLLAIWSRVAPRTAH